MSKNTWFIVGGVVVLYFLLKKGGKPVGPSTGNPSSWPTQGAGGTGGT
jgi:hypothetical protein